MNDTNIAIYLLFYEKVDQTIECIKSFLPSGFKIYVMNNNSSDFSRAELGEFCSDYEQVTIFDSETNLGVGVGRNYLIEHTTEKWMFFVDNDITVKTPDWFEKFIKHKTENPDIEVFIPRLYNLHQSSYNNLKPFKIVNNTVYFINTNDSLINSFPGGCSIIDRELFNRIGSYDKEMFIGQEDFEMAIRAILINQPIRAKLIDDIELVHDHRTVTKEEDKTAVKVRYDIDAVENSNKRIYEKYGIIFKDAGESWTKEQLEMMLNGKSLSMSVKIHLKNFLRKIRDIFVR